jgi:hypothetical protein
MMQRSATGCLAVPRLVLAGTDHIILGGCLKPAAETQHHA